MICCGMAVKKMQTLAVNVRKRKVLTVMRDNDTGKGRQNLTYYVFQMYENYSKILFLSRHFIFGGCLILESSCIRVNMV